MSLALNFLRNIGCLRGTAAPRWARVLLHLSGVIGSPLGAFAAWSAAAPMLSLGGNICAIIFCLSSLNVLSFFVRLAGVKKVGPMILSQSSGGAAAEELLGD